MMTFSLSLLFTLELILALALFWQWSFLKKRLNDAEGRLNESLDAQDLLDFQERVSTLLAEVRQSGAAIIEDIKSQRASLEREQKQAREAEKRLAERLKAFEKAESMAARRIEELLSREPRPPRAPARAKRRTAAPPRREKAKALPLPPEPKLREFTAPEPQAPVSPTASRYLKVYELADQGREKQEIAKETGYLPGEIELILNLRPKSRA